MIARVFPRKTNASPIDRFAFFDCPSLFDMINKDISEVHLSVTWTWDKPHAEYLAEQWRGLGVPIIIGGPAYGMKGETFIPGKYVKHGYTITSRGCNNKCWFCSVWKRDGTIRELPISDGWNILDDNLLACSEHHIRSVFSMLERQNKKPEFTGGLEAKLLRPWHIELLQKAKPTQMFFAYDTPDDYEPLVIASKMLKEAGFSFRHMRCYCLIGYPNDTIQKAEKRLMDLVNLGYAPMAMLWRNEKGEENAELKKIQRAWTRMPAIVTTIKSATQTDLGEPLHQPTGASTPLVDK